MSILINEISAIIGKSPIRENKFKNTFNIKILDKYYSRLEEIEKILYENRENLKDKIKVVLIGEVKSGKSTLVNALLEEEIAYTNIHEATATIMEIKYGGKKGYYIVKDNGCQEEIKSISELNRLYNDNRENLEYFSDIKCMKILIPNQTLKELILVDTPGLSTLTKQNENKTNDYLCKADVILWVMNSNHVGQRDIEERIDTLMDYKKPMILALNKIDEIDDNVNDLKNYVSDEIGYAFNDIYPISGKMYIDSLKTQNYDMKINSGVTELKNYILTQIQSSPDYSIDTIIKESISVQIYRDKEIHKEIADEICRCTYEIEAMIKGINLNNHNIKLRITNKIDEWFNNKFLGNTKQVLLECKDKKTYEQKLKETINEESLNNEINYCYKEIAEEIMNDWINYTDEVMKSIEDEVYNKGFINNFEDIKYDDVVEKDTLKESLIKGGVTSGAVGIGLSTYSAFLGASAAFVTIGSALAVIMPPAIIAGLIGGAVLGLFNKEKSIAELKEQIKNAYENIRYKVKELCKGELINQLQNISNKYCEKAKDIVCEKVIDSKIQYDELKNIEIKIKEHIENLEEVYNEFKSQGI